MHPAAAPDHARSKRRGFILQPTGNTVQLHSFFTYEERSGIHQGLKDLVNNEANFDCSSSGFSLQAMDSSHVAPWSPSSSSPRASTAPSPWPSTSPTRTRCSDAPPPKTSSPLGPTTAAIRSLSCSRAPTDMAVIPAGPPPFRKRLCSDVLAAVTYMYHAIANQQKILEERFSRPRNDWST